MAAKRGNPIPLKFEERLKIYDGVQKGITYQTIADSIGRNVDTVKGEVARNGGPLNYCPHKAQSTYEKRKSDAIQKRPCSYTQSERDSIDECVSQGFTFNKTSIQTGISYYRICRYINKYHPGYQPSTDTIKIERISLEVRIASLEMQLEIIVEQLKELTKCLK